MADIKDRGVVTGPGMRGSDSKVGVLDGHGPACEGDHLSATLDMVVMKDSLLQSLKYRQ